MLTKTYATSSLVFKQENGYPNLSFIYLDFLFLMQNGTKLFFFFKLIFTQEVHHLLLQLFFAKENCF